MRKLKWRKGRAFIVILSVLLLMVGSFVYLADNKNNVSYSELIQKEKKNSEGIKYQYHYLTEEEVSEMMKRIGVRDPNKNYNFIINEHGTGFAPPTLKEWKSMMDKKVLEKIAVDNKSLKSSVRWDLDSHFPPVGNQGYQGSCAAWSVSYYMNGFLQRKIHDWTDDYSWHLMSPDWTYNKVNYGKDQGSYPGENAYIIETLGDASLYTMPYDESDYISWGGEAAWREAPINKISNISQVYLEDINTLKSLLQQGYLINFGINASTPGFSNGNFDGDYILSDVEYSGGIPNHAQTIVGYDDSVSDDGEQGAFRVVNSWGTGWGDNGFYWVTYKCMEDKIASGWFEGLYLIPMKEQPYYPKLLATWRFSDPGSRDAWIDILFNNNQDTKLSIALRDGGNYSYPKFMAVDISQFYDSWVNSNYEGKFQLLIYLSSTSNTVSSFRIEYYPNPSYWQWYDPERYGDTSTESQDVPITIPAHNTNEYINSADFMPEIKIWVYEIKGIDPIEGYGEGEPDWYYYTGISVDDGYTWQHRMSAYPIANDINDLYVYSYLNDTMSYNVNTTNAVLAMELCDKDLSNDDLADISSDPGGGGDDLGHPIPFDIYEGVFWGEWNLTNDFWNWNDTLTIDDYGYWVTSGNYDGSTSTDENDAEVHFWVWDTYSPPIANAGSDKTVEVNSAVKFSGSNSSSAPPDARIVSYQWDFNGDGIYDATGENVSWKFTHLGTYTVTLKVTDNIGKSNTDTCTVRVEDTTSPTISIKNPKEGDLFNTGSVSISWTGSDSGSGIDHYEIKLDDGSWNNVGTSTGYTFTSITDGTHTVYVKAYDKAGNSATDYVSFSIDTTKPSISITSPEKGKIADNSSIVIEWTGSDSGSGIDHYEIKLDDSSWSNIGTSTTHNFSSLSDGTHIVYVKVYDKAGNTATDSVSFTIDTKAPLLNIISPVNGAILNKETLTIYWNATDNVSGVNHYEISVDNSHWINVGNKTTYVIKLNNGEHIIRIKAVDNAGNEIIKSIHVKFSPSIIGVGSSWLWIIILLAIIAIVIVIILYYFKRKKVVRNHEHRD